MLHPGRAAHPLDARMKLDLSGHVVLPGLINAHDHLEFNLFPRLGRGPYANAGEWARAIHHPWRSPVREHLRVPMQVRLWWGALKNLLSGVTTVCHHNPYHPDVFTAEFPVRVVRRFAWAHSLEFEPDAARRYRRSSHVPFLIHCAEGTDAAARGEVAALDALGALCDRTAIVHGVGVNSGSLELLRQRGAALIWCPTSNLNLFGRTVSRTVLRSGIPLALATDSALSAHADLLDELTVARRFLPASRLLELVTAQPARILRLRETRDWIAVRSDSSAPLDALCTGSIALVMVRGRIRLISPELARQLTPAQHRRFQPLAVEGRAPVLVEADVRALQRAARRHLGPVLRVAGKRVLS
jgi:cytosine/adenosine deaminase-related metal-dependent hydrolase